MNAEQRAHAEALRDRLAADRQAAGLIERILASPYIPHAPTPKQTEYLIDLSTEGLYGGAAGGGKSDAMLMDALQFVDVPGYSAILFRRTHTDLALPGALMDRAHQWLANTPARWNSQQKIWRFPSGATLQFAYLKDEAAKYRYQGAEFQFVGFDELTHFQETQYTYLFSRLRRTTKTAHIPLKMRAASNPGGVGHQWVKDRFLPVDDAEAMKSVLLQGRFDKTVELPDGSHETRFFIPAGLRDNPYLDADQYARELEKLDPLTRAQLLRGDWTARSPGAIFRREWFIIEDADAGHTGSRSVRYWDLAATEAVAGRNDPDWTVGVKMRRDDFGRFWVEDVKRIRATPHVVEQLVLDTAKEDGKSCRVRMMQDPGQAGKHQIAVYAKLLVGYQFEGVLESGSKFVRAQPFASQVGAGNVSVLRRGWTRAWLEELEAFTDDDDEYAHDDQVDASSGAFGVLAEEARRARLRTAPPLRRDLGDVPAELLHPSERKKRQRRRLPRIYE